MRSSLNWSSLSRSEIFNKAPSVFADSHAERTSEKYVFIPTTRVLDALESDGWQVFNAAESNVRLPDRQGFQKHMLRLRRSSADMTIRTVGGLLPELVLTNSHDGTSSFCLMLGVFRLVCSNGLLVHNNTVSDARVRHMGYSDADVIEASLAGGLSVDPS